MKRPRPAGWALCAWLACARASAQTAPSGWALDRYEPAPAGDATFLAELPWYRSTRALAAGLTLDYAANPLGLRAPRDGMPALERSVVSGMLTAHLGVAFAPLDRLGFHVSFPVALDQSGTPVPAGLGNLGPAAGPAPGDLRAGLRVRLAGDAGRDPISLHLGALLWVPTGSPADNTGDGAFRGEGRIVLAGRASWLRWSAGAGLHLRGPVDALNLAIGHELRLTAALVASLLRGRLHVGPEAHLFSALRDLPGGSTSAAFRPGQWGVEVLAGARWRVADAVHVGLGGGFGIAQGYGVPEGRALLSVTYAPDAPAIVRTGDPAPLSTTPPPDPAPVVPLVPVVPVPVVPGPVAPVPIVPVPATSPPVVQAPDEAPVGSVLPSEPVVFRAHSARITGAHSRRSLDAVAALLRSRPGLLVDVQVHTGHRSNPGFYRELSGRRADALRRLLAERGVDPAQMQAHGMGSSCLPSPGERSADLPLVQFVVLTAGAEGGRCVPRVPAEAAARERRRRR